MSAVPLLNPETDATLARRMLEAVEKRLKQQEEKCTSRIFYDREYVENQARLLEIKDIFYMLQALGESALNRRSPTA